MAELPFCRRRDPVKQPALAIRQQHGVWQTIWKQDRGWTPRFQSPGPRKNGRDALRPALRSLEYQLASH